MCPPPKGAAWSMRSHNPHPHLTLEGWRVSGGPQASSRTNKTLPHQFLHVSEGGGRATGEYAAPGST
jgi:hypothetical protein